MTYRLKNQWNRIKNKNRTITLGYLVHENTGFQNSMMEKWITQQIRLR